MAKNKKEENKAETPRKEVNEIFEALLSGDPVKTKLLHPTDGLIALAKEIKKLQK